MSTTLAFLKSYLNVLISQIADLLCAVYPKMRDLEGAWMLHKAMGKHCTERVYFQVSLCYNYSHIGGSGQCRLNLVSPDETGYTGAGLARAWGGKECLYIMPIQHRLNTAPLPFTALEFKEMPKARCVNCSQNVPLQLLQLHVDTCASSQVCNSDQNILWKLSSLQCKASPCGLAMEWLRLLLV